MTPRASASFRELHGNERGSSYYKVTEPHFAGIVGGERKKGGKAAHLCFFNLATEKRMIGPQKKKGRGRWCFGYSPSFEEKESPGRGGRGGRGGENVAIHVYVFKSGKDKSKERPETAE